MKRLTKLACAILCSAPLVASVAKQPEFSKISYQGLSAANKILISMHHAVVEINHQQQFIIATLTAQEKEQLAKAGFKISQADVWSEQFAEQFSPATLSSNQKSKQQNVGLSTINGFECYATVEETYSQAKALADNNPNLASWQDIGDSWAKSNRGAGYDLMVLKITNKSLTQKKPILFVHSSMHAREYAPAALNLDFAKWLINNYQTDAEAKWIVDNREVHLVLHMNPDGRKIAENQILQRKNTNQDHCPDSTVGVDLNRNFAQTWGVTANGSSGFECSEVYRGSSAESEPETQAISNYIRTIFPDERGENDNDAAPQNKSGMHIDLHSYGKLILWPYGHKQIPSPNNNGFVHLGNKLAWFNNYTPQQSIGLYATDGTSDNVSYGELGVAAITFELGSSFFQNCTEYHNRIKPDNLKALAYSAKVSEAPYLLSLGPDISTIKLNDQSQEITVSPATPVTVDISASTRRSKLSNLVNSVQQFEYVIDSTFADTDKVKVLTDVTVGSEGQVSVQAEIDTTGLAVGKHLLSIRAKNNDQRYGVVQSVFINVTNNNAPTASFTSNCEFLSCQFNAADSHDSDGSISSYQWHNKDANDNFQLIGSGEQLSYSFSDAGEKTVQLTVQDDIGLSATMAQTITVAAEVINQLPTASFIVNCQHLQCSFDAANSSDGDGSISQFTWQQIAANNASTALGSGQVLSHTFADAGSVTIQLTITDNSGGQASTQQTFKIEKAEPVTVKQESKSSGGSLAIAPFLLLFLSWFRYRVTKWV